MNDVLKLVTPEVSLIVWTENLADISKSYYFEALNYLCDGLIVKQINSKKFLENSFFWTSSFGKPLLIIHYNNSKESLASSLDPLLGEIEQTDSTSHALIFKSANSPALDKLSEKRLKKSFKLSTYLN